LDPSDVDDGQNRLVGSAPFTIGSKQNLTDLTVWGDYFDFDGGGFLSQSQINNVSDNFTLGFHRKSGGSFGRTADVSVSIGSGARFGLANYNNFKFFGLQWNFNLSAYGTTLSSGEYIMSLVNDASGGPGNTLWTWVGSSNSSPGDLYISAGSGQSFTNNLATPGYEKAFALETTAVPIPGTLVLFFGGLLALFGVAVRQHRANGIGCAA
jgi:hypothetical protein